MDITVDSPAFTGRDLPNVIKNQLPLRGLRHAVRRGIEGNLPGPQAIIKIFISGDKTLIRDLIEKTGRKLPFASEIPGKIVFSLALVLIIAITWSHATTEQTGRD